MGRPKKVIEEPKEKIEEKPEEKTLVRQFKVKNPNVSIQVVLRLAGMKNVNNREYYELHSDDGQQFLLNQHDVEEQLEEIM